MDKRSSSEMTGNADGAFVVRERPAPSEAYVAGAMLSTGPPRKPPGRRLHRGQ